MTLIDLVDTIKDDYKRTKSLFSIITSARFRTLFLSSTDEQKNKVIRYIEERNKDKVLTWIMIESGEIPIIKLRKLAKTYGIKNYQRLSPYRVSLELRKILTEQQIIEGI